MHILQWPRSEQRLREGKPQVDLRPCPPGMCVLRTLPGAASINTPATVALNVQPHGEEARLHEGGEWAVAPEPTGCHSWLPFRVLGLCSSTAGARGRGGRKADDRARHRSLILCPRDGTVSSPDRGAAQLALSWGL